MALSKIISSVISFTLGLIRKSLSLNGTDRRNIVVISFHKIGDSVFTIPAIKALHDNFGENLFVVCFEENKRIYELVFSNLNFITISERDFYFGRFSSSKIRSQIKNVSPKIIIDLLGNIKSASLLFLQKTERIYGFNEKEYLAGVYTNFIKRRKTPHLIDVYLDVLEQIIPIRDRQKIFLVSINKKGYVLIHPFAGWKAKEWNLEKYVELARRISLEYKCVFTFPKSSTPQEELNRIQDTHIIIKETNSLDELIDLIKNASVFIGNDSGPLYIANLLGKPTFSIYGPTNPQFSLPFGDKHRFVQHKIKCSPKENEQYCFTDAGRKGCPEFICMNNLSLEEVYSSFIKFAEELGIEKTLRISND
jgi:ADP-heptose:LPS heptosyltransferase